MVSAGRWMRGLVAGGLAVAVGTSAAVVQAFEIKQLEIMQGLLEFGMENAYHTGVPHFRGSDINRSTHDPGLSYGILDFWRISGIIKFENVEEDEWRVARVAVENIWVLRTLPEKGGIGLGWFTGVEASVNSETTNALVFGPIISVKQGDITFTANPFLEKTFGRNHGEGIALSYGWHVKREIREGLAIGIESFGVVENLGSPLPWSEQEHRIGPALFTEFKMANGLVMAPDFGVLFGLTKATPDVAIKFNIGFQLVKGIEPAK